MEKTQTHRPLFIVGNPRSGTTMLRLAVTSHSEISIPPEIPFIVTLFPKYGHLKSFTEKDLENLSLDLKKEPNIVAKRWKVDENDFAEDLKLHVGKSYAEICSEIYHFHAKVNGFKSTIWGDKNTAYYRYLDILFFLFPNAKFIHLIRDGRAILASYKSLQEKEADNDLFPVLPTDPIESSNKWSDAVNSTEKKLKTISSDRYISVHYEDLVTDMVSELKRICKFLNLPYESEMTEFYKLNKKLELEPKEYDSWKWRTQKPVTTKRIDAWKKKLTPSEVKRFEAVAQKTLRQYKYELLNDSLNYSLKDRARSVKEKLDIKLRATMRYFRFLSVKNRN